MLSVPFAAKFHHIPVDYFRYTPSSIKLILEKHNYKIENFIRRGDDITDRKQILETWSNLSIDPEQPNYIEKVIGNQKRNIAGPDSSDPYIQLSGSYVNKSNYVYVDSVTTNSPDFLDDSSILEILSSISFCLIAALLSGLISCSTT